MLTAINKAELSSDFRCFTYS